MSCQVFLGCQASGKTISNITEATRWLDVLDERGLYINSIIDTRDEEHGVSSNSSSYNGISSKFDIIKVTNLVEVYSRVNLDNYNVISIDEIQFFPNDLEYFVKDMLSKGKHIICSGLDSDWMGQDFGQVRELLKLSTGGFTKLSAKCLWCKEKMVERNIRMIPDACRTGKISGSKSQVESGGKDKYIPMCLEHHREHLITIHGLDPDNPISKNKEQNSINELFESEAFQNLAKRFFYLERNGLHYNNKNYPSEMEASFEAIKDIFNKVNEMVPLEIKMKNSEEYI